MIRCKKCSTLIPVGSPCDKCRITELTKKNTELKEENEKLKKEKNQAILRLAILRGPSKQSG